MSVQGMLFEIEAIDEPETELSWLDRYIAWIDEHFPNESTAWHKYRDFMAREVYELDGLMDLRDDEPIEDET